MLWSTFTKHPQILLKYSQRGWTQTLVQVQTHHKGLEKQTNIYRHPVCILSSCFNNQHTAACTEQCSHSTNCCGTSLTYEYVTHTHMVSVQSHPLGGFSLTSSIQDVVCLSHGWGEVEWSESGLQRGHNSTVTEPVLTQWNTWLYLRIQMEPWWNGTQFTFVHFLIAPW